MKLYYAPGACSLAPHILLHETELPFELASVDLKTKKSDGLDYTQINPKGSVPAMQLDDGDVLTEAAVLLQYLADQKPEKGILPKPGSAERYHAQEWLNFVATEVHKGFGPLWNDKTPDEAKQIAKDNLAKRFDFLEKRLEKNDFVLGDQFSAVDAYLFTVLNWTKIHGIDMARWPALKAFQQRVGSRPATQKALKEEGLLQ